MGMWRLNLINLIKVKSCVFKTGVVPVHQRYRTICSDTSTGESGSLGS